MTGKANMKTKMQKITGGWLENSRLPGIAACAIVIAFVLFFYSNIISSTHMNPVGSHYIGFQQFIAQNYLDAVEKYHAVPLWTQSWFAGQPLFSDPQVWFANLTLLYVALFRKVALAINLSLVSYIILGFIGMYFFAKRITSNPYAAAVAGFVFIFNDYIMEFVRQGNPSITEAYMVIPWIFYFAHKALKEGNFVLNTSLAAIFIAAQVMSGGIVIMLYTWVMLGMYAAYEAALDLFSKKKAFAGIAKKSIFIALLIMLVIGFSAVKLFPALSLIGATNRSQGVSYQEYVGSEIYFWKESWHPLGRGHMFLDVGIITMVLVLLSLGRLKNKYLVFALLLIALSIMISNETWLAKFFYEHVPGFDKMRNIQRGLVLMVIGLSISAGIGFAWMSDKLKKAWANGNAWLRSNGSYAAFGAAFVVIALMAGNVAYTKPHLETLDVEKQHADNELANFLQDEMQTGELFRIYTFDIKDIIAEWGEGQYSKYGIQHYGGGGSLWDQDYAYYTYAARTYAPSKLLGAANVKYLTSRENASIPGFSLYRQFRNCTACYDSDWTSWLGGPYLLKNEDYLPRYYYVNSTVLVLGDQKTATDIIFTLMLTPGVELGQAAFVHGKQTAGEYNIGELRAYDYVILGPGSFTGKEGPLLKEYADNGGMLLPDIFGNVSIDMPGIAGIMSSLPETGTYPVTVKYYSPNKVILGIEAGHGNAVFLAERFYLHEGWTATFNGKAARFGKANGMGSLVMTGEETGELVLAYKPKAFAVGMKVTLAAIFMYLAYIITRAARRHSGKKYAAWLFD